MQYKLAPYPLAFFNEGGMRKSKKSALYTLFEPTDKDVQLINFDIVVDGGFLVHKVVWQRGATISTICDGYIRFLKTHYHGKSCTVLFDGYAHSSNSTKLAEQSRRYRLKRCVDINFNMETDITVKQEDFLSNVHNKSLLIDLLRLKLHQNGINTLQASNDADLLIVNTAIEKSRSTSVAVIGEDVDLAVLLMAKTPTDREILLIKPGRGKVKTCTYSTQQMQQLGMKDILFLHAFTGCDTTSAAYRKSKVGFAKMYKKLESIQRAAEVFLSHSSSPAEVERAGVMCTLRWYGAPSKETSLNEYRYRSFVKAVANIKPDISTLPPSEGAVKQHAFQTYHQVQVWLGNNLPPQMWGWEFRNNQLIPTLSENEAAPDEILNMIFCRCLKNCDSGRCGCRKASLNCSLACQNCHGNCHNGVPVLSNEEEDEEDLDPCQFH